MKSLRRLFIAVALPLLVGFITVGCSGLKQPPTKTLSSIAVTPASPAHLKVGATQQFTATGTYSDGTNNNVTASATWSSSNTTVATISNTSGSQGLATAAALGSTTITATVNTIKGSTSLAVQPAP